MSDAQQVHPDWKSAPFRLQGIGDERMMKQIEMSYPPPKYKITKAGPDDYGFYFYSVEEQ